MSHKLYITPHACLRYMERVLEIEPPENGWLNKEQIHWLRTSILLDLAPIMPQIESLGDGQYHIGIFTYVIRDGQLRTVKMPDSDMVARYSGGILTSGKKIKKNRSKKSQADRLIAEKERLSKVPKLFFSCTRV